MAELVSNRQRRTSIILPAPIMYSPAHKKYSPVVTGRYARVPVMVCHCSTMRRNQEHFVPIRTHPELNRQYTDFLYITGPDALVYRNPLLSFHHLTTRPSCTFYRLPMYLLLHSSLLQFPTSGRMSTQLQLSWD